MRNSDRAEMNDIIGFLSAWADEDERVARQVSGSGRWSLYMEGGDDGWAIEDAEKGDPGAIVGDEAMTQHMARHDPARVLAFVEVIRQVINDYRMSDGAILRADNPDYDDPGWRGIYAGRDAFKSVLRAYAKAAGWKAGEPLPHGKMEP